MKHVFYLSFQDLWKIMLVVSTTKKVIVYSKAFKYPHYKKVFLDEKNRFSDMKKFEKRHFFFFKYYKKFLSDLVYKLLILFVS